MNQGLNNNKPEYDTSVGYISNRDNSFNNAPPRPVFSNEGSGSYSMRFPRTDSATSDTKNLEDLPSRRDETGLNLNSEPQVRNVEDSNAGQQRFQDMAGPVPDVDSSILRAIVQNESEVDPSFNHDEPDLIQKTTLDPSANLINDRTSVYSNDAEEKRKGKVLDPITVPVLNEIKSETTSIESQSNKYKDLGTELESNNDNDADELFDPRMFMAIQSLVGKFVIKTSKRRKVIPAKLCRNPLIMKRYLSQILYVKYRVTMI